MSAKSELHAALEAAKGRRLARRPGPMPEGHSLNLQKGEASFSVPEKVAFGEDFEAILDERFPGIPLELLQVIEVRSYLNMKDGEPFMYIRAKVREVNRRDLDRQDIAKLIRGIKSRKPVRAKRAQATDDTYHVALSDWQLGIGRDDWPGKGVEETEQRIVNQLGQIQDHLSDLRRIGQHPSRLALWLAGDTIDQCFGHYPSQLFVVELTTVEQLRMARRLIMKYVDELALPSFDRTEIFGVASNHGEIRQGPNKATTDADSYDLMLMENIGEMMAANHERYGSVSTVLPADPLVANQEFDGFRVGLIHGHQAQKMPGGGQARDKVIRWWQHQDFGRFLDVDLLLSGHFHTEWITHEGGRHNFGLPANDGGSRYFTTVRGSQSRSGVVTFTTSREGWDNYRIFEGK